MSSYLPMIIGVCIVVVFYILWMTVFQKKFAGKYAAAGSEAHNKFQENKEEIVNGYLTDPQKYGLLTEAVDPDEKILGIASFAEPKGVGKALTEGLKTSITKVRKVNMDLFYLVITDKNLHSIESNGENTVNHVVFALDGIEDARGGKGSAFNVKNAVTGTSGDFNSFSYTYKGEKYSYNLYKVIAGYARFDVSKDTMSGEFVRSFPGMGYTKVNAADPAFMLESMVNTHFLEGFRNQVQSKLGVTIPQ